MRPPDQTPIFFIGAPRSGTTLIFNAFAARPDLAWFSQHLNRLPRWPVVTVLARLADSNDRFRKSVDRSDRRRHPLERLRVGPSEAYGVWEHYCGERFLYDFLLGAEADPGEREAIRTLVAKLLRYQGKDRFATKITGPARIGYLRSIFPDARFVHVIRDGRAVASSLLEVYFWKGTWREREPSWRGGLADDELDSWRGSPRQSLALAALQWRAVIRHARAEAEGLPRDEYMEVRYEHFVADPHRMLDETAAFCGLPPASEPHEFLESRVALRDMNYRWRERFDPEERAMLDELLSETLSELGYESTDDPEPSSGPRIEPVDC